MTRDGTENLGPVIGITVSQGASGRLRPDAEILYVRRNYAQAVRAAGGVPLLVPPDADPADAMRVCDGFVISGGADLPASFATKTARREADESQTRIDWDRRLLDLARDASRPVLGVCYGMQLANLHYGGTLLTDIAQCVVGALDHGGGGRASEHAVAIAAGSALHRAIGPTARVCSRHHQAVDRVADGFATVATAPDGVIEAIASDSFLGVEWHPEADATARAVYGWLIRRIEERA